MPGVTFKSVLVMFCLGGVFLAAEGKSIGLDVPFVKQEKNGCGAATIAMIMEYWQRQPGQSPKVPDAQQILRDLYSKEAHGIYAYDMESYFREHGFRTFAFAGEWSDLQQHLEKGRPLIVALRPGSGASLHYVVVAGLEPGYVLTNDPSERKLLKQARSNFEKEWKAAKHWTLLAVPSLRSSSQ